MGINYKTIYQTVEKYAQEQKIKISTKTKSCNYDPIEATIYIHRNYVNTKLGAIILLHELGHSQQTIPLYKVKSNKFINTIKMNILHYEIDAWERGWVIAHECSLFDFNILELYEEYLKQRLESTTKYIKALYTSLTNAEVISLYEGYTLLAYRHLGVNKVGVNKVGAKVGGIIGPY